MSDIITSSVSASVELVEGVDTKRVMAALVSASVELTEGTYAKQIISGLVSASVELTEAIATSARILTSVSAHVELNESTMITDLSESVTLITASDAADVTVSEVPQAFLVVQAADDAAVSAAAVIIKLAIIASASARVELAEASGRNIYEARQAIGTDLLAVSMEGFGYVRTTVTAVSLPSGIEISEVSLVIPAASLNILLSASDALSVQASETALFVIPRPSITTITIMLTEQTHVFKYMTAADELTIQTSASIPATVVVASVTDGINVAFAEAAYRSFALTTSQALVVTIGEIAHVNVVRYAADVLSASLTEQAVGTFIHNSAADMLGIALSSITHDTGTSSSSDAENVQLTESAQISAHINSSGETIRFSTIETALHVVVINGSDSTSLDIVEQHARMSVRLAIQDLLNIALSSNLQSFVSSIRTDIADLQLLVQTKQVVPTSTSDPANVNVSEASSLFIVTVILASDATNLAATEQQTHTTAHLTTSDTTNFSVAENIACRVQLRAADTVAFTDTGLVINLMNPATDNISVGMVEQVSKLVYQIHANDTVNLVIANLLTIPIYVSVATTDLSGLRIDEIRAIYLRIAALDSIGIDIIANARVVNILLDLDDTDITTSDQSELLKRLGRYGFNFHLWID